MSPSCFYILSSNLKYKKKNLEMILNVENSYQNSEKTNSDNTRNNTITTLQFLYLLIPLVLVRYLSINLNSSLLIVCGEHFLTSVILKSEREKFS